ncbi:MAG: beta strand repeat-containing protein [Actinomycetota bacterium]
MRLGVPVLILVLAAGGWLVAPAALAATTITVDTTADDNTTNGNCTLREAIIASNGDSAQDDCPAGTGAGDTIAFDITGTGQHTISPTSELPSITQGVTIDGASDPDDAGRIEIDGAGAGLAADGLEIGLGTGTVITDLVINDFAGGAGVRITGLFTTGNEVRSTYIGVEPDGVTVDANFEGVVVESGSNGNTIGGTAHISHFNVVSGNDADGISISGVGAAGNIVAGNRVGTDLTGAVDVGNGGDGVRIAGAPNTVFGQGSTSLVVSGNTGDGIEISGASGTTLRTGFIGTAVFGNAPLGNDGNGIRVINSIDTTIGTAITGHAISANGEDGIRIQRTSGAGPDNTTVIGNRIGIGFDGVTPLGNVEHGIAIMDSAGNTIGGTGVNDHNVISDNGDSGVLIEGTGATGNLLERNRIGTNNQGTLGVGNDLSGVTIFEAPGNTLRDNLISGNVVDGVTVIRPEAAGNVLHGNLIGPNLANDDALPNGGHGVFLFRAVDSMVGGTGPGQGNVIAANDRAGVAVAHVDAQGNAILGNSIFQNDGIGIDLGGTGGPGGDGVTPNDGPGDPDGGPNGFQNFPDLAAAANGSTHVTGSLDGEPSTSYRVELFANAGLAVDPTGHGEGDTFLGAGEVTTDASGVALFGFSFDPDTPVGDEVAATATELGDGGTPGSTSELSEGVEVAACPTPPAGGGTVTGGPGADILCGGPGDDTFVDMGGDDLFVGRGGNDTVDYSQNPAGITADLGEGTVDGASTDLLDSIESVTGSPHADTLLGDDGPNALAGGPGDDTITGGDGDDSIDGGGGRDDVDGGAGNDTLLGAGGRDLLKGQAGKDLAKGGGGRDRLRGQGGPDRLRGQGGPDNLKGHGGRDRLFGNAGRDRLNGGGGRKDLCRVGGGKSNTTRRCERP